MRFNYNYHHHHHIIIIFFFFYYWPVSQDGPPVQLGNKSLTFHPAIGALVVDFSNVTLINYFTFIFEWSNSSSPSLRFTMDYSFDGLSLDGVRGGWTSEGYLRRISLLSRSIYKYFDARIFVSGFYLHFCRWASFYLEKESKETDE